MTVCAGHVPIAPPDDEASTFSEGIRYLVVYFAIAAISAQLGRLDSGRCVTVCDLRRSNEGGGDLAYRSGK